MMVLACRLALASLTARKAFELEGSADAASWLADGRSSSAISAPQRIRLDRGNRPRPRPHPKPMERHCCFSLCRTAHDNAPNDTRLQRAADKLTRTASET